MNPQDFLNVVRKHQPCTSRSLYEPLLALGYYATKPENEAIEDIAKHAHYLRNKGLLKSEKQTGSFGVRNVWSVTPTETESEETDMTDQMPSDVAEIEQEPARKFITRVTRLTIAKPGTPIFSDLATHIEIDDEAGGEFIRVNQNSERPGFLVDVDEWPYVAEAIDVMLEQIQANAQPGT